MLQFIYCYTDGNVVFYNMIKRDDMNKIVIFDLDGTLAIEWGAYGVPESFLIYNNEIIKKYVGPLNQGLVDEINLLIK